MAGGTREYWEDVLEDFRDDLTNVLRPDRYFDKFRSERILDERDTQEINNETLHPSRAKKAGHFLDILRTRGSVAYRLLLDCLEADHSELYKKMTGSEPEPKAWTYSLPRRCSCECHDDRTSLDFIQAYREEKQSTISLKLQNDKLQKDLEKVKASRLKLKHAYHTLCKEHEQCQSDREQEEKMKNDIRWQRDQICDLQGKAYNTQQELIQSNALLREAKLENNALQNRLRETQARENLQRKKSIRLEQERTESTEKMKAGDALKHIVEQLTLELEKKKIEEARKSTISVSSEDHAIQEQTAREIMIADRDAALQKCEEAVKELYDVRKAYYDMHEAKEKLEKVNEELETRDIHMNEQVDMIMDRLEMAQDELEKVSEERTQAIRERNNSIEETALCMVERDELVKRLNKERSTNVKLSRQLFDVKNRLQRLKREMILQDDRPPSVISTDGSSGTESKRSSATHDFNTSTELDNSPTLPSIMCAPAGRTNDTVRSTSLLSMSKFHRSIDEEEEDDFDDYDEPSTITRIRRGVVLTKPPASVARRKSDPMNVKPLPANGDANSLATPSQGDKAIEEADAHDTQDREGGLPITNDKDDGADPWSNFDYNSSETNPQEKPDWNICRTLQRRLPSSESLEVHAGSLKEKSRTPGPRISSCDLPSAPNYLTQLNRRSKTMDY